MWPPRFPVRVDLLQAPQDLPGPRWPPPGGTRKRNRDPGTPGAAPPSPLLEAAAGAGATTARGLHPTQVDPPFPVRSLLLTFAYLIPMNFLGQLAAGTLLQERIRRRGVLVLSAPLSGPRILAARMTPFAVLAALVLVAATVARPRRLDGPSSVASPSSPSASPSRSCLASWRAANGN